jgi:hypothetical protein
MTRNEIVVGLDDSSLRCAGSFDAEDSGPVRRSQPHHRDHLLTDQTSESAGQYLERHGVDRAGLAVHAEYRRQTDCRLALPRLACE